MITTTLISSCHWKTLVPFYLRKKRLENALLTLKVNYRKIALKKQIMPSNWLFNDILCYLLIACFDWKVGVFHQTVVGVYYILKGIVFMNMVHAKFSKRPTSTNYPVSRISS